MKDKSTKSPVEAASEAEVTEVTVEAAQAEETTSEAVDVDVEALKARIVQLEAENKTLSDDNVALRANIVEPIEFPDFEALLKQMQDAKMSLIDQQNAVLSSLVLPFQLRGYKMATNTATSFGDNGRESQNGVSHKAQYSLNSLEAVRIMPENVIAWLQKNDAAAFVFGDTSWLSADEIASKKANQNTSGGWQGF